MPDDILWVLPEFETAPFRASSGEPANSFLRTVVRRPLSAVERPMPVGVGQSGDERYGRQ